MKTSKIQVRKANEFFVTSSLMTEREKLLFQKKWGGFDDENEKAIQLHKKRCSVIDADFDYLLKNGSKLPEQKTEYMMHYDKSRFSEIPEAIMIPGEKVIQARIDYWKIIIEGKEEAARKSPNPKAGKSDKFAAEIIEIEKIINSLYSVLK